MKELYTDCRVYTGEGNFADSFAVEDGRFIWVGTAAEMPQDIKDGAEVIKLGGAFVCAGFNDSHMHLLSFGLMLNMAQLAAHTDSLSGMLDYLRSYLAVHPVKEGGWLRGRGWNQDYFTDESRMPDRRDLDRVSRDVPIMITRCCGHSCVVNTKVLELAGITADTPSPEGGKVGIDADGPDGRFFDNAMGLLTPFIPVPGKAEIKRMLAEACTAANKFGITSVQTDDYCVFPAVPYETVNEAYRELEAEGLLTLRVNEQCNFSDIDDLRSFIAAGYRTGKGSSMFKSGPLKLLGDGSLGARTAHLTRPYADDPATCGFSLFSPEQMNELVMTAQENGLQVAVHTIGDACLDEVLDAVEAALKACPKDDMRHGIVHCQISRADQLERIAKFGMHVYAQSIFLDYDSHIIEKRVGSELASTSYSWKTLADLGVSVSNGSDCPVELPDVLEGIECAVTRTSLDGTGPFLPEQAFTVAEAIDTFTVRGAEASFDEKEKGLIKAGYLADFTVLERDPFTCEPREIHKIAVKAAYLNGRQVY